MTNEILYGLVAFAFVSSITPGPNNLMLMASGTNFGFTRTIPHMLGVALGFVIMLILVGVGLINVFNAYPLTYVILKIFSVIYLLYLAWKIANSSAPRKPGDEAGSTSRPMTFLQAALFQWVNPKAWAMALTAVSAYTPENAPIGSVLLVGVIFGLINLPSVSVWVSLGTQLRRILGDPFKLRVFNVTAAVLLVLSVIPILMESSAVTGA